MVHLRSIIQTVTLLLLVPTALADTLTRTMCYCGTPSGDLPMYAGCYYLYEYHSNPYNVSINVHFTCKDPGYDNDCTMRFHQKKRRCGTIDKGWEFCYHQRGKQTDKYTFMGVKHSAGGLVLTQPKTRVDMVCGDLCMKHVHLPLIPTGWDIQDLTGHVTEWRGDSKIETFPELADIVLPQPGYPPPHAGPAGSDGSEGPYDLNGSEGGWTPPIE